MCTVCRNPSTSTNGRTDDVICTLVVAICSFIANNNSEKKEKKTRRQRHNDDDENVHNCIYVCVARIEWFVACATPSLPLANKGMHSPDSHIISLRSHTPNKPHCLSPCARRVSEPKGEKPPNSVCVRKMEKEAVFSPQNIVFLWSASRTADATYKYESNKCRKYLVAKLLLTICPFGDDGASSMKHRCADAMASRIDWLPWKWKLHTIWNVRCVCVASAHDTLPMPFGALDKICAEMLFAGFPTPSLSLTPVDVRFFFLLRSFIRLTVWLSVAVLLLLRSYSVCIIL